VGSRRLSRRSLLGAAAVGALGAGIEAGSSVLGAPSGATGVIRLDRVREPGSLPNPADPPGKDQVPQIENFTVVMMENHSFDNVLGMLGRGDCFPRGSNGRPTITLPDGHGNLVHAFHMPSECQTNGVGQNWNLAHHSLVNGNRGFVEGSTGEALGYFLEEDLPFTWDMARTFPIADRWFSSLLGQTDPNRRYLMAGTSLGQVADQLNTDLPPNGTIFDMLNRHGVTWRDYYSNVSSIGVWLPLLSDPAITANIHTIDRYYADAAAGTLPQFSFVEPNYTVSSEENPQDIQFGDQFLASIVNAMISGPQWKKSMLIWTYDEWGGWYDHVPPPAAIPPDNVLPILSLNQVAGRFDQYGFRVPAGVVSPLAKRDFVSHTVYDHTSVLSTLERKWNLPALTRRDANANDLFDMVDLQSPPAFDKPPTLKAPANPALTKECLVTGPGTIPPSSAVKVGAVPNTPVIEPSTLPSGVVGKPYQAALTASSVRQGAKWIVLSGDLPAGLVLGQRTGTISGTPTAAGSSGATIGVSEGHGPVGALSYTVQVTAS
jgi:phospholipase C